MGHATQVRFSRDRVKISRRSSGRDTGGRPPAGRAGGQARRGGRPSSPSRRMGLGSGGPEAFNMNKSSSSAASIMQCFKKYFSIPIPQGRPRVGASYALTAGSARLGTAGHSGGRSKNRKHKILINEFTDIFPLICWSGGLVLRENQPIAGSISTSPSFFGVG